MVPPTLDQIEAPPPSETQSASSEYIERAALAAKGLIPADEMLKEDEDWTPSQHIELQEAPGEGWTPEQSQLHPRWPPGTPGGLGGKFMKVGQVFELGGKDWEIQHIFGSEIVANEASGDYHKVQAKVFDTKQTPGEPDVLGGAKRPPAKKLQGGKGELVNKESNITVVDPYNHPETHDPTIPVPKGSSITAEEWKRFGRPEQLHYSQVQERFGKHTASGASKLITQAYQEYDAEIQNYVSGAYQSQYGGSSGFTLSLSQAFDSGASGAALESLRTKREEAKELQGKIRDAYAWDLYNRTHQPDVVIVHKDDQNNGTNWWKQHIVDGNVPLFSGLSQSHHFRKDFWSQQVGILDAVSARQIVMSTWVAGPLKGSQKDFQSEEEMAIGDQVRVDSKHAMSFHQSEVPDGALGWLESQTQEPAGGDVFRMFKAAIEEGAPLPIPPPKPNIQMEGEDYLPAPQEAADAVQDLVAKLPGEGSGNWDGTVSDLKGFDIPFKTVDANGDPVAQKAPESKPKPGDYLMGLKGTLYWLGPDPSNNETGLRLYKIVPGDSGQAKVSTESFAFDNSHPNYVIAGYHQAPATLEKEVYDPNAWVKSVEDPVPIAQMEVGQAFMVDTEPYEIIQAPQPNQTTIKSLASGLVGHVNSDYQAHKLELKANWVPAGKNQPQKGMTFNHHGVKHTITFVAPNGEVSAKAAKAGAKVVKLQPDDPALTSLFDPTAWKKTETVKAGDLEVGDLFSAGKGDTIRPFKVTEKDETWVNWENLDTGETGKSMLKKKVTALEAIQKEAPGEGASGPPVDKPHDQLQPGDVVKLNQLKIGDLFHKDGHTYSVQSDMQLDSQAKPHVSELKDGVWTQPAPYGSPMDTVTLFATYDSPTGQEAANFPTTASPKADILDSVKPKGLPPGYSPFTSHKSGSIKHPKVKEMPNGAVFVDKAKNKYLVIDNTTHDPLVTDGLAVWAVPPDSRGKVLEGAAWDKAVPVLGGTSAHAIQHDLTADDLNGNPENFSVSELPVGTYYLDGEDRVVVKVASDEWEYADVSFAASYAISVNELQEIPKLIGPPETFHTVQITKVSPSAPDNVDHSSLTPEDLVLNNQTTFADVARGEYFTGPAGQSVYRKINDTQFITANGDVEDWFDTFEGEIPMHVGLKDGVAKTEPNVPALADLYPNELGLSFDEVPVGGYISGPGGGAMFKKINATDVESVADSGAPTGMQPTAWAGSFDGDKPSLVQKGIAPTLAPDLPPLDKQIDDGDLTDNVNVTLGDLPVGSYFLMINGSVIRRKINDSQYIILGEDPNETHSLDQLGTSFAIPDKIAGPTATHTGPPTTGNVTVGQMGENVNGLNLEELPIGAYYAGADNEKVMQKISATEVALLNDPNDTPGNQHIPISSGAEGPFVPELILTTEPPAPAIKSVEGGKPVGDLQIGDTFQGKYLPFKVDGFQEANGVKTVDVFDGNNDQKFTVLATTPASEVERPPALESGAEFVPVADMPELTRFENWAGVPFKVDESGHHLVDGETYIENLWTGEMSYWPDATTVHPMAAKEEPPSAAPTGAGWPPSIAEAEQALSTNPGLNFAALPNGTVFGHGGSEFPVMRKVDEGHYEELGPEGGQLTALGEQMAQSSVPPMIGIPPNESLGVVGKAQPGDFKINQAKLTPNDGGFTQGQLPVGAVFAVDAEQDVIGKILPYGRLLLMTEGASTVGYHHTDSTQIPYSVFMPGEPPAPVSAVPDDETYAAVSDKLIDNKLEVPLDSLGVGTLYSMGPTTVAKIVNDKDSLVMTADGSSWTQETPATIGPNGYPEQVFQVSLVNPDPLPETGSYDGAAAVMKPNATALQFEDLPVDSLFLIDQWTVGKKLGPSHVEVMNDHGETWDTASEALHQMPHPPSQIKLPPGWTAEKGHDVGGSAPDAPAPPTYDQLWPNSNQLTYAELPVGAFFAGSGGNSVLKKLDEGHSEIVSPPGGPSTGNVQSNETFKDMAFAKILIPGESKAIPVDQSLPETLPEAQALMTENTHGYEVKELPVGSVFSAGAVVAKKLDGGKILWINHQGSHVDSSKKEWDDYVPEKVAAPPNSGFGPLLSFPPDEPEAEPEAVAPTAATLTAGAFFKNANNHPFEVIQETGTGWEVEDKENGDVIQITSDLPLEDVQPLKPTYSILPPSAIEDRLLAMGVEEAHEFPHGTLVEKLYFGSKTDDPLFYVNGPQAGSAVGMQGAMQQITLSEMNNSKHPPGTVGAMKEGDEFENANGATFQVLAQGTVKTFVKDADGQVSGIDQSLEPSEVLSGPTPAKTVPSSGPVSESSLDKLLKAAEAGQAKDDNGNPDWLPVSFTTYKSSYSGGTKLPQISEMTVGDSFTTKGSKEKWIVLRWEPGGKVLVYATGAQVAGLANAAIRVKPASG